MPPATARPTESELALHRFLRCGHILGSLLREILEQSYLSQHCHHALTRTQFCLLKLITLNADLQLSEMARYLGVSPAAITKNVDKLEKLGLLHRDPSSQDRRAIRLTSSPEGHNVVAEYEDIKAARIAPVVDSLDAQELEDLCDTLEALCVELVRHGQTTPGRCVRCAGYYSSDCLVGLTQGDCALRPHHEPTPQEVV